MTRRGQAALEFLTTYGWAFLIILVMVGAISYFGILKPSTLLPSRCTISSEFECTDYKIGTNGFMQLQLKQGLGKTVFVNNITCTYNGNTVTGLPNAPALSPISWSPRNAMLMNRTVPGIISQRNQKTKVFFDITYRKSSTGLTHVVSGEVFSEVK